MQLGVIAPDGTVLFNSLVNPQSAIAPEAEAIHGISQAMVEHAPTFAELVDQVAALLKHYCLDAGRKSYFCHGNHLVSGYPRPQT